MNKKTILTLGVASCVGGPSSSCAKAPHVLKDSNYSSLLTEVSIELDWQPIIDVASKEKNSLRTLYKQSCVISQFSQEQIENHQPFLVLGGDHSIAVGTWAGVMNQLPPGSTFALIWIDAHMDAHTIETSPSGNLHGMPVSMLLGEAEHDLQVCYPSEYYLHGKDLYLFGVRSFEADELVMLSKEKVNVFDTGRIESDGGTRKVLKQLIDTISRCYDYYAISLDLDAIDPEDAPGVETRADTGIRAENLLAALDEIDVDEKFLGLEIAEFDPGNDIENKTEKLVFEIIRSVFKVKSSE